MPLHPPGRQSATTLRTAPGARSRAFSLCPPLALAAALVLAYPQQPVQAQGQNSANSVQTYHIAPGPLADRLNQFARQSGLNLSFTPEQVQGLSSRGLEGSYTVRAGLEQLLNGSGLSARAGATGYTLEAAPATRDGIFQFSDIEVQGAAPDDTDKDLPFRSASSMKVLSRDDIELFRGTSVGDIFQGIPGVLIGENRNSGGLDVNIRGMQGQGRVPVLVDGARQETTVYRGYSGVSSRSYIDPDLIGGILIEKGPTMSAGGEGATGGLVSARTIGADDILRDGQTFGVRVRGQMIGNNSGSAPEPGTPSGYFLRGGGVDNGAWRINCSSPEICNEARPGGGTHAMPRRFASDEGMDRPDWYKPKSWAGSIALAQRFAAVDLVAAYARREQGNYYAGTHGPTPYVDFSDQRKLPFYTEVRPELQGATRFRGGERIANTNFESESTLVKAKFLLPADHDLELSWLRYDSSYGELMPSQLLWTNDIAQTNNSHVTANTYTSRYRWTPADNAFFDVKANLWHTNTKSNNDLYAVSGDFASGITTESSNVTERYKRTGFDISNTSRFAVWGMPEWRYGFSLQRETVGPDGKAGNGTDIFGTDGDARAGERREYNLFTAIKWEVLPSLTLDAGLRYSRYKSEDHKAQTPAAGSAWCEAVDAFGKCLPVFYSSRNSGSTPLASLTWEPTDGLQVYLRYAEAIRMPSLFENTSGFSVAPTIGADLKPEHAYNREIGMNLLRDAVFTDTDKLRVKLAYFSNTTSDYLTRTVSYGWEDTDSRNVFRMRNIDKVSVRGAELSVEYDAGVFFFEAAGTRYNHIAVCEHASYRRYDCTDYGLANSYVTNMIPPRWHASSRIGTRLFDRRLMLGVRGTFMGQRNMPTAFDDTRNGFLRPVPWHSYRIFDVFATYRVNDNMSVDFNIDNITDRYYLDALSLGLVPAPGRTARLGVTLQF
ncbi:TonB-dependent receptor [Kerstersia gyiorum]|uniref:TonB-dependent receptor n=1 Tax=Kerstersia gyiorum TaxID=206506 RepID=UPI0009FBF9D5|nr:TonB-dependent receptor [Kerstersia gyiorum]